MVSENAYLVLLQPDAVTEEMREQKQVAPDSGETKKKSPPFLLLGADIGDSDEIRPVDAIIVLGSGIWGDYPTPLLAERLDTAIALYEAGASERIIMSGDGENPSHHDEPLVMANYAISRGVPEEAILLDRFGLNTHATVYRAIHRYELNHVIFVSQHYHLERTLYLARMFGLRATGVYCDKRRISGQTARDVREVLARVKDFFVGLTKGTPNDPRILLYE